MSDICGDNRFETIAEYKKQLIEGTNIASCPEEMAVIDSILFRFWQMGWIPAADVEPRRYAEWISPDVNVVATCSACGTAAPYDVDGDIIMYWPNLNFCPYCGCKMNVEGKNAEVH